MDGESKEDHDTKGEESSDEKIIVKTKSWKMTGNNNSIEDLLKQSHLLLNQSQEINEPFQKSISLETSKEQMVIYLQTKIDKVTQRIRLVEHKYGEYKKLSDAMNIGIILLSTTLTLLESVKSEIGIKLAFLIVKHFH